MLNEYKPIVIKKETLIFNEIDIGEIELTQNDSYYEIKFKAKADYRVSEPILYDLRYDYEKYKNSNYFKKRSKTANKRELNTINKEELICWEVLLCNGESTYKYLKKILLDDFKFLLRTNQITVLQNKY